MYRVVVHGTSGLYLLYPRLHTYVHLAQAASAAWQIAILGYTQKI